MDVKMVVCNHLEVQHTALQNLKQLQGRQTISSNRACTVDDDPSHVRSETTRTRKSQVETK